VNEICHTYAHFGSGLPQSAQYLFAGWFNKYSNISLALAGSVSENHHKEIIWRSVVICSGNT